MTTLTDTALDAQGGAVTGEVVVELVAGDRPTIGRLADGTIVAASVVTIGDTGAWSAEVPANSLITPTGTLWRIRLRGPDHTLNTSHRYCAVPDTDTVTVAACEVDVPDQVDTSALSVHVTSTDAHGIPALVARIEALEALVPNLVTWEP